MTGGSITAVELSYSARLRYPILAAKRGQQTDSRQMVTQGEIT
jgi:hypothetical protein